MATIINVSRIIDYSGEVPVETPSNPVQTEVTPIAPATEIPYHYDLSRCCCCCNSCCMQNGGGIPFDGAMCPWFD